MHIGPTSSHLLKCSGHAIVLDVSGCVYGNVYCQVMVVFGTLESEDIHATKCYNICNDVIEAGTVRVTTAAYCHCKLPHVQLGSAIGVAKEVHAWH